MVNIQARRLVPVSNLSRFDNARVRAPCTRSSACEGRSEEHTSELQSLMRKSYAGLCLKKKKKKKKKKNQNTNDNKKINTDKTKCANISIRTLIAAETNNKLIYTYTSTIKYI